MSYQCDEQGKRSRQRKGDGQGLETSAGSCHNKARDVHERKDDKKSFGGEVRRGQAKAHFVLSKKKGRRGTAPALLFPWNEYTICHYDFICA